MVAAVDVGGTLIKSALVLRDVRGVGRTHDSDPAGHGGVHRRRGGDDHLVSWATGRAGRLSRWRSSAAAWSSRESSTRPPRWPALAVNLGWSDLHVSDAVRANSTGLVTVLGHDVRAALVAEVQAGAARGVHNVLFIALGTGIAAAVMVDGQVLAADGWAGELGHVVVDPLGPTCACGGTGCLEAMSSASAVARAYAAAPVLGSTPARWPALVDGGDPVAVRGVDRSRAGAGARSGERGCSDRRRARS